MFSRITLRFIASVALLQCSSALASSPWTIEEMQPNIPNGGRANGIAVDPAKPTHLIVASDTGGLFTSWDGGVTWKHNDAFAPYSLRSVAFYPKKPLLAFASGTGEYDFNTSGLSGVWKSADGGQSWSHVVGDFSKPSFAAYELAFDSKGRVYAGTSAGLAVSNDEGATWHTFDVFGSHRQVFAVAVGLNGSIYAAANSGLRISTTVGLTWKKPNISVGVAWDHHALGVVEGEPQMALFVNDKSNLFVTQDGGSNWAEVAEVPLRDPNDACGGIAFIKGHRIAPTNSRAIVLYYGNKCDVFRKYVRADPGRPYKITGPWTQLSVDHRDTRDIAFDPAGNPILLGTDGGLHRTTDGGASWTFTGGGKHGYNALQLTEVAAQQLTSIPAWDFYIGTQDNSVWASPDGGFSWPQKAGGEGFFIELQPRVDDPNDSFVTVTICGACLTQPSSLLFLSSQSWMRPPGTTTDDVKRFLLSGRLQGVDTSTAGMSQGLAITWDRSATWQQFASFPEARRNIPHLSENTILPVVYQTVRTGYDPAHDLDIEGLVRVKSNLLPPSRVTTYPAMAGFGGLGLLPTQFAWYSVLAVDPRHSAHLVAPDVIGGAVMQSFDGGESWATMPSLTTLVLSGGAFRFANGPFPLVTAIAFDLNVSRVMAVGMMQSGVAVSEDGGASWSRVPGSELATYVTSIRWLSPYEALISTYGRGLWRIRRPLIVPPPVRPCPSCAPQSIRVGSKDVTTIYALQGKILGGSLTNLGLSELVVSPGTLIAQDGKPRALPVIKNGLTWQGFQGLQPLHESGILAGLSLGPDNRINALLWNAKPLPDDWAKKLIIPDPKPAAEAQDVVSKGSERTASPTRGKPYVWIVGQNALGRLTNRGPISIVGQGFLPGQVLSIRVLGQAETRVIASPTGEIKAKLPFAAEPGRYLLLVKDASGRTLDGLHFLSAPFDQLEANRIN